MTIRKVLRAGHPILRSDSEPIEPEFVETDEFNRLVTDMFQTMHDHEGVGLAAPQVQQNLRILVFEVTDSERYEVEETTPPTVLANPEIIDKSSETELDWEGCLSLPELRGEVPRHEWVKVKALNESGEEIECRFDGFTARVVQHEMDHLNGRLFPQQMESMDSLCFFEEYRRFHADDAEEHGNPAQQELDLEGIET